MFEIYDNVYFIDDSTGEVNCGTIVEIDEEGFVVSTIMAYGENRVRVGIVYKSFDAAFASLLSTIPIQNDTIKRYISEWQTAIADNGKLTNATLCEQLQLGVHVTLLDEDVNPSIGLFMVKKHGRKYLITVPAAMINCTDALHDCEEILHGGTISLTSADEAILLPVIQQSRRG